MSLIETKGAASAQGFGEFLRQGPVNYIEDVFSTYLYTGNSTTGGTQTITNNIDLSTKGGMVWIKGRSAASDNILTDTTRGAGASATNNNALSSNLTSGEDLGGSSYDYLSSFSTTGFVVTQGGTTTATRGTNYNNVTYVSWTFRKQPKFFDIQTFTVSGGTGSATFSHNLGSTPGCIFIKNLTGGAGSWVVYHRSLPAGYVLLLNLTLAQYTPGYTIFTSVTSTSVSVDQYFNNGDYVAYLFAHNAGGFGLSGTDNVISCGSYTTDGSGNATVNLGYEPQCLIWKPASDVGNWQMVDNMRGWIANGSGTARLFPNTDGAEVTTSIISGVNATGFNIYNASASSTQIYIAIRRGPMKVPTDATKVFGLNARSGTGANATVTGGQVDDAVLIKNRGSAVADLMSSRLTGTGYLETSSTAAEVAAGTTILQANPWDVMDGVKVGTTSTITNASSNTFINYLFRRAPGFFDEVCYTGTGSNTTQTHNLGVVPELIIVKRRDTTDAWDTYSAALSNTEYLVVNTTAAKATGATRWNSTTPTSTVFSLGTSTTTNASGGTYVAYLFATCAGVSKVGSYTGTGTTLQVDCGFTGGARFVLIKRTDSTGDWYVWDSARGIVSGNDPYLLLNSTAAEVTNTDYVDTYSAGFEISSTAPAAINANGGTYIFLAIA